MDQFNDVFITDPYQSLEADLDDVSDVIGRNFTSQDFYEYPPNLQYFEYSSEHGSEEFSPDHFGRHSSPYNRDAHTSREIGSIVAQLQQDDVHFNDFRLDFENFCPPSEPSTASSYPNVSHSLNSVSHDLHAQHISRFYPNALKNPDRVSEQQTHLTKGTTIPKTEEAFSPSPSKKVMQEEKALNTKEELMALLEKLTPEEVEKLRVVREGKSRQPPLVGVATKLTAEDMLKKSGVSQNSPDVLNVCSVSSPLTDLRSPSSDNNTAFNESDMELDSSVSSFPVPRTKRRTAHNLIEKKYRCSINDRIQQMKSLVADSDAKLSKSVILRLGIDHILALRQKNEELENEVMKLRQLLKDAGVDMTKTPTLSCEDRTVRSISPISKNLLSTSVSPDSLSVPQSNTANPMVDKAKVTIFAIMFVFVICNPLSIFMRGLPTNMQNNVIEDVIHSRTLQQVPDDSSFETHGSDVIWWQSPIVRPCFIWSVNIFIIICFLTRLLVYGEPVADGKSSSWVHFLNMKANAYTCIRRWNYPEAKKYLQECLKVLERPLPTANFDELISVIWQIIRHLLNSVWIGRWFSRVRRSSIKTVPVVCRSHAQTAVVYHQLNQLHIIETSSDSDKLSGLNLALSAVNLAESAGCSPDGLSHALRADIYINAALQMKLTLPPFLGTVFSMYFMRRAKRHVRRAEEGVRGKLMWLFHPLARRFIADETFIEKHLRAKHNAFSPFVRSCSFVKPVERLISAFKMEMLKLLVVEVTAASGIELSYFAEVSRLLFMICSAPNLSTGILSNIDSTSFDAEGDELCAWWTHVFICALHWRNSDCGNAPEHYAAVRKCPKPLLAEPISLALGHAFCSRKLCIHDRESKHFSNIVWNHAIRALSGLQGAALSAQCVRPSNVAQNISDKVRLLSLEWLLRSLFDVWHSQLDPAKPYWQQLPSNSMKYFYEDVYIEYRTNAREEQSCYRKIAVFELTLRVLNGSNPVNTWRNLSLTTCGRRVAASGPYISERDNPDNYPIEVLQRLHSQMNVFSFQTS